MINSNPKRRALIVMFTLLVFLMVVFHVRSSVSLGLQNPQNERRVIKRTTRKTPVTIGELKVKNRVIDFRQVIRDDDDDWFRTFSLTFRNTSGKDIALVQASLTLFFPAGSGELERTPYKSYLTYGSENGSPPHVRPGKSAVLSMTDERYSVLQATLINMNYPLKFSNVEVFIESVLFSDGLLWRAGRYYRRDPLNPEKWIRDIEFKKGGQYENLKRSEVLKHHPKRNGPVLSSFSVTSPRVGLLDAWALESEKVSMIKTAFRSIPRPLPSPTPNQNCGPTAGSACERGGVCYEAAPLEDVPCLPGNPNCFAPDWDVEDEGGGEWKLVSAQIGRWAWDVFLVSTYLSRLN